MLLWIYYAAVALLGTMQTGTAQSYDDSPVQLSLYYETLCPYCKKFILNQLYPTYKLVGEIMDIELVPYGNAKTQRYPNGTWAFKCQHGPNECYGNLVQTCAIKILDDIQTTMEFVHCMEDSPTPNTMGPTCAKNQGIDYNRILQCITSKEGNDWQREMAVKTVKLNPQHKYVPWIVFDGVHTDKMNERATTELLKLICELYKGEKPSECL